MTTSLARFCMARGFTPC